MIIKKLFLMIFIIFMTTSCTSFQEAGQIIRNEKVQNTDEFLIKKKEPLTVPPDFNKMPLPNNKSEARKEKSIQKLFQNSESKEIKSNASTSEQSIINQIKK